MKKIGLLCFSHTILVVALLLSLNIAIGDSFLLTSPSWRAVEASTDVVEGMASLSIPAMDNIMVSAPYSRPIKENMENAPALTIQVGVVSTDSPYGLIVGPLPSTASFGPPGSVPSWTGSLNSTQLISTPLRANIQNLDGNDSVTFALVVQNVDSSNAQLLDIHLQGIRPTELLTPTDPSGMNLQSRNGQGDLLHIESLEGGLFGEGIRIKHLNDGEPMLTKFDATSGENLAVVTFDLDIQGTVPPSSSLPISVRIVGYSFQVEGSDVVAEFPLDTIQAESEVFIAAPKLSATVVNTSQHHDDNLFAGAVPVAIGDVITYEVTLTLPEGSSPDGFLKSEMDQGFALLDVISVEASDNVTTSVPGGFEGVRNTVRLIDLAQPLPNQGQKFDLFFGALTVQNSDINTHDTNELGYVRMRYRVVALNNDKNLQAVGEPLRNQYLQWCWSIQHHLITEHTPDAYIVEPTLHISQTISSAASMPEDVMPGDVITITLSVAHGATSAAAAHDVQITDLLPPELQYVADSLKWLGDGVEPTSLDVSMAPRSLDPTNTEELPIDESTINVLWEELPKGATSIVQFQARLTADHLAPNLESEIVTVANSPRLSWSSVPGLENQDLSIYHDLAAERTDDANNVGGNLNTYFDVALQSLTMEIPATAPEQALIEADLSVENLTRASGATQPGDRLRYQLTTRNIGTWAALNVTVSNRIEQNLALVGASVVLSQGSLASTLSDGADLVKASLGTIALNEAVTIEYEAIVVSPLLSGTTHLANQALILGDNFALTISNDPTTIEQDDPTIVFTTDDSRLVAFSQVALKVDADGNQRISAGDAVEYEVEIVNRGHGLAEDVLFSNSVGENAALVIDSVEAISGTIVAGMEPGQPTLQVELGTLAPGESTTVRFSSVLNGLSLSNVSAVENQGVVVAANHPAILTDDPTTGTLDDSTSVLLVKAPAILATKSHHLFEDRDQNGFASPGDILAYRIALRNRGNIAATDIVFSDITDGLTSLIPASFRTTRVDANFLAQPLPNQEQTTLTVSLPLMGAAGSLVTDTIYMSYLVEITQEATGTATADRIRNQGIVDSNELPSISTHDPIRAILGVTTETFIDLVPHVEVLKRDILLVDTNRDGLLSPPSANGPHERLLYQIRLRNLGNTTATSVILEDTLDSYARLIPESVRTNRGEILVGTTADSRNVVVELGPIAKQQIVGAAEGAIISFEVELNNGEAPLQIMNLANILVNIDNNDTDLDAQYTLPSDDPDTEDLGDATITSVTQQPTTLDEAPEPQNPHSVGDSFIYLPLFAIK